MKLTFPSISILLVSVYGCSSSSSTPGDAEIQTLRLISEQVSLSNEISSFTNYEYDERGNLIGSVTGGSMLTYSINSDGSIIEIVGTNDGVPAQSSLLHSYDPIGGLRRVDNLASVQNIGVIGVSAFDLYEFDGELATSMEVRTIPFEDIVLDAEVDESAGLVLSRTEFEYDGQRIIRELIDNDADGGTDSQRDYTYNSDGTLSSVSSSGASTSSTVYLYEQGACNLNWGNSTHGYFCVSIDGP